MSSSSTASSDEEIRIGNNLNSSVPNPSKQPPNKIQVGNNPILQKGILNKDIQNILNKVNSRNKKTAQKKYEVMSSTDSEASSGTETVGKSNKTKESAPNKPVSRDESDSESSDSVEEIKFPGPKIIKQEADLASYRPGVDLTDTTENMFPKPIKVKKEPGIDESDRGKVKKSPGSKKRISNKQEYTAELRDDTKKSKKLQEDKEPSPRTRMPEISMNGEHEEGDFENQPSDSDDEKFVEKIEAAVEKKSKINVLQNVTITKPSTPKDQLSELHPNLERLQNKLDLDVADADLYLLMIPNSVDPFVLLNQESIHHNCKIKVGKKYSLRSTGKTPDPCLVLSDSNKIIQFKDTIVMSQYIKKQKMPEIDVVPQEPVGMPDNLKNRHPLFGSLFEEHIQLSGETQQKLDDAVRNKVTSSARKPKKKKEKKSKVIQEQEPEEIIYDLLNYSKPSSVALASGSTIWKETTSVGNEMPSQTMNDSGTKSSKKRKRNSDHAEHLEQREDINENVNVPTLNGRNKSNVKKELLTEYETDAEPPTKKRRKKSIVNELDHRESSLVEETFKNAVQLLSKKTKAEIKRELLTEYETDVEPLTKKKKKKKALENNYIETNNLQPQSNKVDNFDDASEEIKGVNIPKKSRNIKLEIFTEYETEAEVSPPKKKKRKSKTFQTDEEFAKSELSSTEMVAEIETDISLNNLRKKKRKLKKLKSEPLTEYETDTEKTSIIMADMSIENDTTAETSRPKKKKKNSGNTNNLKKELLTEYETDAEVAVKKELMTEYETDVDSLFPSKKKRRKLKEESNRRSSLANSTLKTDVLQRPSFCPDVSYIREENFTQNDGDIDVIEDSLIDSVKIDIKRSKKIKKEKN